MSEDMSVSWGVMAEARPDLADYGKVRLDGKVAYLATVRRSGLPRAHPVTPVIGSGRCFIFVEPSSPKARDLVSNGYFCIHCTMNDSSGSSGEFQMTGQARQLTDAATRTLAESVASYRPSGRYLLFELLVSEALSTDYRGGRPSRRRWSVDDATQAQAI